MCPGIHKDTRIGHLRDKQSMKTKYFKQETTIYILNIQTREVHKYIHSVNLLICIQNKAEFHIGRKVTKNLNINIYSHTTHKKSEKKTKEKTYIRHRIKIGKKTEQDL